jgi:excisionase family DNA binding protein
MTSRPEAHAALADELCAAVVAIVRRELSAIAGSDQSVPVRLLAVDDVADRLGVGRSRLYQELSAGRIQSIKVGRRRLIPESALYEYVRSMDATGHEQD